MFPVSSRFGTSRCGGTRRHHGVGVDLRVWGEVDLGMAGWGGRREGASDQGFPGTPTWNWSKVGGCMGYIHDRNTFLHGLNGSGPGTFPLWTGKVHFVIRSSSRPGMFPVSACETYWGGVDKHEFVGWGASCTSIFLYILRTSAHRVWGPKLFHLFPCLPFVPICLFFGLPVCAFPLRPGMFPVWTRNGSAGMFWRRLPNRLLGWPEMHVTGPLSRLRGFSPKMPKKGIPDWKYQGSRAKNGKTSK
jgi:hypothetical protein